LNALRPVICAEMSLVRYKEMIYLTVYMWDLNYNDQTRAPMKKVLI